MEPSAAAGAAPEPAGSSHVMISTPSTAPSACACERLHAMWACAGARNECTANARTARSPVPAEQTWKSRASSHLAGSLALAQRGLLGGRSCLPVLLLLPVCGANCFPPASVTIGSLCSWHKDAFARHCCRVWAALGYCHLLAGSCGWRNCSLCLAANGTGALLISIHRHRLVSCSLRLPVVIGHVRQLYAGRRIPRQCLHAAAIVRHGTCTRCVILVR